jgi:hypothetical protein
MRFWWLAILFVLPASIGGAGPARADAQVAVLATYPSGTNVILPRNENFYLRLAYSAETPVGIWVAPYFQGQRVGVGSSPSTRHTGRGEALAWFFFMHPGDRVDEIRVMAGDGGTATTPVVAVYRVQVTGGSDLGTETPPDWIGTMKAAAEAAMDRADKAKAAAPFGALDTLLYGGFMLLMLGVGIAGLAGPVVALIRWRGGWRLAALVPAALMGFVVLRLLVGVAQDPTSHNLWPFEILIAGCESTGVLLMLFVARRIAGGRRWK